MKHDIYLRYHTSIPEKRTEAEEKTNKAPRDPQWAEHVLVLDTETTTDARQSLNFGAYRFCRANAKGNYQCIEEGLFYADDLDKPQIDILSRYQQTAMAETTGKYSKRLKLYSRSEFMEEVFLRAVQSNAAIVAFNLPFDLSRLALKTFFEAGLKMLIQRRVWCNLPDSLPQHPTPRLRAV